MKRARQINFDTQGEVYVRVPTDILKNNYKQMKHTILLLFAFTTFMLNAQVTLSKDEIKQKTDSILVEGDLLYQYEKAAWVSTDQSLALKDIKKKFGGYFIYKSGDSIKAIILEKGHDKCIYEMTYINDFSIPNKENLVSRELNELEKKLLSLIATFELNLLFQPQTYALLNFMEVFPG